MGGSVWHDSYYADREAERARTKAPAFTYHSTMTSAPVAARKVHEKMDPKGVKVRESRDSAAHPNSLAISVMFDHTGSMGGVPVKMQKKLADLMGLLQRKGYAADPQILFGSIGDTCDKASLQVGQFESGIEMDDDLGKLWLEGGGGGSMEESYQNAIYFFARHTSIDCLEKRGKKGYLFIVGDEKPYNYVKASEIRSIIGDEIQTNIPTADIIRECQQKYHIFFVLPNETSHFNNPEITKTWSQYLSPENVIRLEDPDGVCEAIATAIGLCEGNVDISIAETDLTSAGVSKKTIRSVTTALDGLAKSTALARSGTGSLPEADSGSSAVGRL